MDNKQNTRDRFRRLLGLDDRSAIIGDSAGVIYEPGRTGFVRVRYPSADGYGYPTVVRLAIGAALSVGLPVRVGWKDGEVQVKALDNQGLDVGNWNGYIGTTTNQQTNGVDLNLSPLLLSTAFGVAKPLYVTLFPLKYVNGSTLHYFPGVSGGIDLSSYVPGSANEHCIVGIFVTPSDVHEIQVSTVKDLSEPLGDDDCQECITAATALSIPAVFWRLYYGQTLISDTDKWLDIRQWINVPSTGGSSSLTIDDGTTTVTSVTSITFNGAEFDVTNLTGGAAQVDSLGGSADDTGIYIGTWW